MSLEASILNHLVPFTKSPLMSREPESLSGPEVAIAYRLIKLVAALCKTRLELLKPTLATWATEEGKPTEKGGHRLITEEGFEVRHEKRQGTKPEADTLRALCVEREIPLLDAFTAVKVLNVDPTKVQFLVDTGQLKAEDVAATKKVSWAIRVIEPKETKPLLEAAS